MPADEIAALPQGLLRQADRRVVVVADELGVGGNAVIYRREWIAGTEPQCAADGQVAFLPASAIAECDAVKRLRQREIRIEAQRQLEFGQRVVEAPCKQIRVCKPMMSPRVF